jgi:hypothetical protein
MNLFPGQRVVHHHLGLHGIYVEPAGADTAEQPYVPFDGSQITEPSPVNPEALIPEPSN